jgi:hypothetical protein
MGIGYVSDLHPWQVIMFSAAKFRVAVKHKTSRGLHTARQRHESDGKSRNLGDWKGKLKGQDVIKVLWNAEKGKCGNNIAKYKEEYGKYDIN